MDKVGIILVNYKNIDDTMDCIKSIKSSNYSNYVIIIVDNECCDVESKAIIEDASAMYIAIRSNLGFGGANNVGYKLALEMGCDLVWVLNNDTIVMPDTLDRLVDTMRESLGDTAIVGGTLRYHGDLGIQAVGGGRVNWCLGFAPLVKKYSNKLDFISGACMLINPSVVGKILFDPLYFMYWEDTDLCLRVKRKGFVLKTADQALVLHKESASLGKFNPVLEEHYGLYNQNQNPH